MHHSNKGHTNTLKYTRKYSVAYKPTLAVLPYNNMIIIPS